MDPNAEDRPPSAGVAGVEVEVEAEPPASAPAPVQENATFPSRLQTPLADSIFRNAFERPMSTRKPNQSTVSPEEERQLQEEAFQRKLRGEYEATQRRLGDVVTSNMDRPLRLTSIRLAPPPKGCRPGFLSSLLTPFLAPAHPLVPAWLSPAASPPETLQEILHTTRSIAGHLDKFGIWDMSRAVIRLEPVRGGGVDEVEMVLGLVPRGRLFLKVGTNVGAGEGTGDITARIRNALGGGETLELVGAAGTTTKRAYQATLTTPLLASPLLSFGVSAFAQDRDNSFFASHREESQGGRAKLSAICPWGTHDLSYEYVNRDITHLRPTASVSIRELANGSTKSSIIHSWMSDTRDDPWTGRSGRMIKASQELAGLPGSSASVRFFKTITQSNLSRALYPGSNITVSLSSLTTLLYPLTSSPTQLPDRTYLGGPNSIRGWKVGGAGPRDGHDSLGGDMSWAAGLSVFAPIPGKDHWPLKIHGYLNAGKVVAYDKGRGVVDNITKLASNPNLSVGLGLMFRIDPIRVELNFGMPLVARKGERLQRGFDLGVGIEFL